VRGEEMEIFVDNLSSIDSLRRNGSGSQNYNQVQGDGSDGVFRDELLRRINELVHERSLMEMQAQFAPVITTDRMSHIIASNNISRLRVKG
jgi:hypothetical protein